MLQVGSTANMAINYTTQMSIPDHQEELLLRKAIFFF